MNKFLVLVIVSIIAVPLCSMLPVPYEPIWYSQFLGLMFALFAGGSLVLWGFDRFLSVFSAVCLFNVFFVCQISPRSMCLLYNLYLCSFAAYGISRFNKQQRKKILYAVLAIALMYSLWMVLQAFNFPIKVGKVDLTFTSLLVPGKKELIGFAGSKDQLGSFYALVSPALIYLSPWFGIFPAIGLIISKSSFAVVAASAGLLLSGLNKVVVFSVLSVFLLGFFLKAESLRIGDFTTRGFVWKHALTSTAEGNLFIEKNGNKLHIKCNPLFGFGFGNFLNFFPYVPRNSRFNYDNEKFTHAHNDFIETYFELGVTGLIALGFMLAGFVDSYMRSARTKELTVYFSTVVVYLLNSLGNFVSQLAVSGMLLVVFYGMYKGALRDGETSTVC